MLRPMTLLVLCATPASASDPGPRPYLPTVESFPRAPAAELHRTARVQQEGTIADLPAYARTVLPPGEVKVGKGGEAATVLPVDDTRRWMAGLLGQWFTRPDGHVAGMLVAETGDRGMPMCIVKVDAARSGERVGIHLELDPACPR